MKRFALTSLAMAVALTIQAQAEEQIPPPPAGPYQSFALMPETPEMSPHPHQFPPMNYEPDFMQAPEPPAWVKERPQPPARPDWVAEMPEPGEMGQPREMPEPPAWVKERPQPPARPDWVAEMPEPGKMGQPREMPEPPDWVKERPQPPARPDWVAEMPEPGEMGQPPAWVKERPQPPARPDWAEMRPRGIDRPCPGYQGGMSERPCRRLPPEMMDRPYQRPEPPAWVKERPQWPEMRGSNRPDFERPSRPSPWEYAPYSDRGFPPAGYDRQLTPPPAPPVRRPVDMPREPYAPGYYPYPRR